MADHAENAVTGLLKVRKVRPLVHHITNFVVMNETANITLSLGALPVMAHAHEEVEEMAAAADALVLNMGTLDPYWIESMLMAGKAANKKGIPVVFDPVGAGATSYRTKSALSILDSVKISVIRGNGAEIAILAGSDAVIKGVDSISASYGALENGSRLSARYDCAVAITGKEDLVVDGFEVMHIGNGHRAMSGVTGTGCMSTAVIAAFSAVDPDRLQAAASALACFGIAGELASSSAGTAPGSFHACLYDSVAGLDGDTIRQKAKIEKTGRI